MLVYTKMTKYFLLLANSSDEYQQLVRENK